MLNGIDPIIIFNFKKLVPGLLEPVAKVPVVADSPSTFPLPLIPIYLSEKLTGIYIDSESKNMEIDTSIDTLTNGGSPVVTQKGITSSVKIQMVANSDSIGVALFAAMADLIFPKVTSKEYSITYLHGAVTIFNGLLHSFSIDQEQGNSLYKITIEIQRPGVLSGVAPPVVTKVTGTVPL